MEYYTMISSSHLDMQAQVELVYSALEAQRLEESAAPEIACFGDGHRCKRFPCPICNQGRSRQLMLQPVPHQADGTVQSPHGRDDQAVEAPVLVHMFGDGGHTCRRFPCPVCQQGRRRSANLEV